MKQPDAEEIRVILQPMNRVVTVPAGTPLLAAITLSGISIESICGGKGTCGKCRVILDKGSCRDAPDPGTGCRLSQKEREAGYHLACQVTLLSDAEFTIPVESRIDSPQILVTRPPAAVTLEPAVTWYRAELSLTEGLPIASRSVRFAGYAGLRPRMTDEQYHALLASEIPKAALISSYHSPPKILALQPAEDPTPLYGVAIDLGTTTVVGCLARLDTGEILATASALDRQITYGEELLTRIGYAASPEGLATLQKAAATTINDVIGTLALNAGLGREAILDLCIAGNTVMNHILCGLDVQYLELADAPVSRVPLVVAAREIGLVVHPSAEVYCLPNVSRFVGGDAIGDMITAGIHASDEPSLMVDLGTNGEIIVGNRHWAASVSCASGPAFEGAGIRAGMRAMKGAIDHVQADPATGTIQSTTIGFAPPRGICGSGIVDLAVAMVETGALDFAGKLNFRHGRVRTGSDGPEYLLARDNETGTGREITITQQDIDYLMDSKAAACGAIAVLLARYRYTVGDIRHLFLAGAFGAYTDIEKAVRFGIIPRFPAAAVHTIGNGSLSGAYSCLVSVKSRAAAESLARHMVYIDLMVDTAFSEEYAAALYIPGRPELFP